MRQAFAALKSQFIAHHDMLEAKEVELVRQDGKVGTMPALPCPVLPGPALPGPALHAVAAA